VSREFGSAKCAPFESAGKLAVAGKRVAVFSAISEFSASSDSAFAIAKRRQRFQFSTVEPGGSRSGRFEREGIVQRAFGRFSPGLKNRYSLIPRLAILASIHRVHDLQAWIARMKARQACQRGIVVPEPLMLKSTAEMAQKVVAR
jgi:hypothetical protein